ncbi:NAD-dependent epimerase/dehydratase family protein [Polaribacter sp. R77954]|uniref:NAD-dependent epimerase/dehydratase family protein n=1 Tax=Polaribacter sp. R77954 TaxID=3093870 RepID=UPI0037CCC321
MKVLILGGTGAMGVHLVSILSGAGNETVVTSRRTQKSKPNIKYIQGDAHNIDFLNSLLTQKWDVIVDFMVYKTNEFKERVAILLKKTNQYVYLSSSRVFADSLGPITEESPRLLDVCKDDEYLKTDEYGLAKARQEDILKNSGFSNWTIIRPSVTFSENRLQLGELAKEHWLYRALANRTIVVSKDIMSKYATLTYGLDVSKAISAIIGEPNALKEVFNITVSEAYKWEDMLSAYVETIEIKLGKKPKILVLDKAPIPDRYVVKYDKLFDRKYDNSKIKKYFDFEDATPTLSALQNCMEVFFNNQVFLPIDWKKEAFLDRLSGDVTPLSEILSRKDKIMYLIFRYTISYKFLYKMHQIISRF